MTPLRQSRHVPRCSQTGIDGAKKLHNCHHLGKLQPITKGGVLDQRRSSMPFGHSAGLFSLFKTSKSTPARLPHFADTSQTPMLSLCWTFLTFQNFKIHRVVPCCWTFFTFQNFKIHASDAPCFADTSQTLMLSLCWTFSTFQNFKIHAFQGSTCLTAHASDAPSFC